MTIAKRKNYLLKNTKKCPVEQKRILLQRILSTGRQSSPGEDQTPSKNCVTNMRCFHSDFN